MKELKEMKIFNSNVDTTLKKEFVKEMKDKDFENYIRKIPLPVETIMKYTSHIKHAYNECKNCSLCGNINECKNDVVGFYEKEYVDNGRLRFELLSCKYKNKEIKEEKQNENVYVFDIPKEIRNAKMKDIYLDDAARTPVIKYLTKFIKEYDKDKKMKGLYLNGNFGCGKTYLISATFNELSKKGIKSAIVYWPEFLRSLKESFDDDFKEK